MKLSDRIMIFFLLHRSINTPENIPKMPCGNMAAIVAKAKVSADLVSKVSHKMMAKLTSELVSMEKNCPDPYNCEYLFPVIHGNFISILKVRKQYLDTSRLGGKF